MDRAAIAADIVDGSSVASSSASDFRMFFHELVGGVVDCGCGQTFKADHQCSLSSVDKLVVLRCGYKPWNRSGCSICYKAHGHQLHLDATYEDKDGGYKCRGCDDDVSSCICPVYVAPDGTDRCKNCKELWCANSKPMDGEMCLYCTFNGVSCAGGGFLGSDGVYKCKSCKVEWDGRCSGCGMDMLTVFNAVDGGEVWDMHCQVCDEFWDSKTCRSCLFDGGEMTSVDTELLYNLR